MIKKTLQYKITEKDQGKTVEPDGTEAVKYLKGETLTGDTGMSAPCEKGWVLICTGNVSLGWGKMAAGTIKNHYPKGLR